MKIDKLLLAALIVSVVSIIVFIVQHFTGLLQLPLFIFFTALLLLVPRKYIALIAISFVLINHQYGSDPYDLEFTNYFSGVYKYIIIIIYLFRGFSFKYYILLLGFIVLFSIFLLSLYLNGFGYYIVNDLILYLLIMLVLLPGVNKNDMMYSTLSKYIYYYALTLPFHYVIIVMLGFHTEIYGSTYTYYGHLFSLLVMFSTIYFITNRNRGIIELFMIILNNIVMLQSAQSSHLLTYLFVLTITFKLDFKSVLKLSPIPIIFIIFSFNMDSSSWFYLKVNQLVSLFTLDVGGSNSLAIRYAEFLNIYVTNTSINHILGNGIGATYTDVGYLSILNVHEFTFPEEQLSSGIYYLIHEPILKVYFNFGLLGILLLVSYIYNKFKLIKSDTTILLIYLFFFLFFSASINNTLFTFIILMMLKNNK